MGPETGVAPHLRDGNNLRRRPNSRGGAGRFNQMASQAGNGNVLLELAGYAANPAVENTLGYFYFPGRLYLFVSPAVLAGPSDHQ